MRKKYFGSYVFIRFSHSNNLKTNAIENFKLFSENRHRKPIFVETEYIYVYMNFNLKYFLEKKIY